MFKQLSSRRQQGQVGTISVPRAKKVEKPPVDDVLADIDAALATDLEVVAPKRGGCGCW